MKDVNNRYLTKCRVEEVISPGSVPAPGWGIVLSSPAIERPFSVFHVTDTRCLRNGSIKAGDEVLVKFMTFGEVQKADSHGRFVQFYTEFGLYPAISKIIGRVIDMVQNYAIIDIGVYLWVYAKQCEHHVEVGDYGSILGIYQVSKLLKA